MQSNLFTLDDTQQSVDIDLDIDTHLRTIRSQSAHASTLFLMQQYISSGNMRQTTRLAAWVMKQPNANDILNSITLTSYLSLLESMESQVTLYDTKSKCKRSTTLKINLPTIACLYSWMHTLVQLSAKRSILLDCLPMLTCTVFARLASLISRIVPSYQMRLVPHDRRISKQSCKRIRDILHVEYNHYYLFPTLAAWQIFLLLDTISVHRTKQTMRQVVSKPLIDPLSAETLADMIYDIVQVTSSQSTNILFPHHDIPTRPSMGQVSQDTKDAALFAPFLVAAFFKLWHHGNQDNDNLISAILAANAKHKTLTTETTVQSLLETVESMMHLGCFAQSLILVRAIQSSLALWIPKMMKPIVLSHSAQQVLSWNYCPEWNAYLNRLALCMKQPKQPTLARSTAWMQQEESIDVRIQDLVQVSDPLVWLSFATVPSLEEERAYMESIHNFTTSLSRWCACTHMPGLVSDDALVFSIKQLWTERLVRQASRKSFDSYWAATMMSNDVDTVFRYCVPPATKMLKDAMDRLWPRIWQELVDELAPEPLRDAFHAGIHPQLIHLMRDFMLSHDDRQVQTNIQMLFDFCAWTFSQTYVNKFPSWVYLYECVWKHKAPVLHVSCVDNEDDATIREWLSHVNDRCLLSFALGIRATTLATGRKPEIPATIAKWIVKELMTRPLGAKYKKLLTSKMQLMQSTVTK